MSETRPNTRSRSRRRPSAARRDDFWRARPALPEPSPIVVPKEPTALVRSLGDPPLAGSSVVAGHYLATVVERASALAAALAASADLLAEFQPDSTDD